MLSIYTDGSYANKKGGFSFIVLPDDDSIPSIKKPSISMRDCLEDWGWPPGTLAWYGPTPYDPCTNQISELFAIYWALKTIKGDIKFYTDSKYAIGCLETGGWSVAWTRNGWTNTKGKPVKNLILIKACLRLMKNRKITFCHVRGHGDSVWNEHADFLANLGRD